LYAKTLQYNDKQEEQLREIYSDMGKGFQDSLLMTSKEVIYSFNQIIDLQRTIMRNMKSFISSFSNGMMRRVSEKTVQVVLKYK